MRTIAILGATGSIGTQAADVVMRHPDMFDATVLTAHGRSERLFDLARKLKPQVAGLVVEPESIPDDLKDIGWFFGEDCSEKALKAARPDDALASVVGIAGLPAVITALDCCERVLLANKEALVTGGNLVMNKARERGVKLIPVDSEHSAIFQCLEAANKNAPSRLILTCSGGSLRDWDIDKLDSAKVSDVVKGHPTWNMGAKITVDCATMMNKGLEVMEAKYLFDMPQEKIDVIMHPDSIVHSLVEFEDGAMLAQLGTPDMRVAIAYAMSYPKRVDTGAKRLDLADVSKLSFYDVDERRYPLFKLATEALKAGGSAPIALNAANEEAVGAFIRGRISFGGICGIVKEALERIPRMNADSIQAVYECDRVARIMTLEIINRKDLK
ncbi:MAG: 1-deoxy-D-xylulose-5-phosphate reductoisomerase [Clostridia bacterium]|nr:1-deoxy-D-xylulose-5-phosphate reductoisomerase [Clostridia bacterium]